MLETRDNKNYVYIIGGKIAKRADENTPGAVKRDFENPTTKEKGTKWELVYDNLRGVVTGIRVIPTDYGDSIQVDIDDVTLCMGTDSKYGKDFMRKAPLIMPEIEVNLVPYAFEKEGKKNSGLTVYQKFDKEGSNAKVPDFFYNIETKEQMNGMPLTKKPAKEMKTDDWKIYYIEVKQFLVDYLVNHVIDKFAPTTSYLEATTENDPLTMTAPIIVPPQEAPNLEDVPFN